MASHSVQGSSTRYALSIDESADDVDAEYVSKSRSRGHRVCYFKSRQRYCSSRRSDNADYRKSIPVYC